MMWMPFGFVLKMNVYVRVLLYFYPLISLFTF